MFDRNDFITVIANAREQKKTLEIMECPDIQYLEINTENFCDDSI